ncbi:hypothetical protein [Devosia sp.]|uniref:hypothetical protein n=1 Tax=Devosia sp. TaxID=1871048 RepID=UPI003263E5D4
MFAKRALPLLAAITLVAPSVAQEVEPPAPWAQMTGKNAGAAGTCAGLDGSDTDFDCYMVRCDAGQLVFVFQPDMDADKVHGMNVTIGNGYAEKIMFDHMGHGESTIDLASHPRFLAAMVAAKPGDWANWETVDAEFEYTTFFELTDAGKRIKDVQKTCKR